MRGEKKPLKNFKEAKKKKKTPKITIGKCFWDF